MQLPATEQHLQLGRVNRLTGSEIATSQLLLHDKLDLVFQE
jgi:hypothetical protein